MVSLAVTCAGILCKQHLAAYEVLSDPTVSARVVFCLYDLMSISETANIRPTWGGKTSTYAELWSDSYLFTGRFESP